MSGKPTAAGAAQRGRSAIACATLAVLGVVGMTAATSAFAQTAFNDRIGDATFGDGNDIRTVTVDWDERNLQYMIDFDRDRDGSGVQPQIEIKVGKRKYLVTVVGVYNMKGGVTFKKIGNVEYAGSEAGTHSFRFRRAAIGDPNSYEWQLLAFDLGGGDAAAADRAPDQGHERQVLRTGCEAATATVKKAQSKSKKAKKKLRKAKKAGNQKKKRKAKKKLRKAKKKLRKAKKEKQAAC